MTRFKPANTSGVALPLVVFGTAAGISIVLFAASFKDPEGLFGLVKLPACASYYERGHYEGGAKYDWICQQGDGRCRTTVFVNDGPRFEDRYYYSRGCIVKKTFGRETNPFARGVTEVFPESGYASDPLNMNNR